MLSLTLDGINDPLSCIWRVFYVYMFIENATKKRVQLSNYTPHIPNASFVTPTLQIALEEYLNWKMSYAPIAAIRYHDRLKLFIQFKGEQTHISQVAINDIISFHNGMKEQGYSPKTIEYSCVILKNFFKFWSGRGMTSLNPVEIRPMKCLSPDKHLISAIEFRRMSDSLDERFYSELIRKLAIHLLWDCGMRVSELCDINISDIEETSTAGIRCAKIRRRKARRYNIVVWGKETNRLLNLFLGLRLCLDYPSDALLVSQKGKGERITPRTIQRWVNEVAQMASIDKKLSPHCFRHSKAHRVLDKSENVRDVQCVLGHSSALSSFHYLGLNKERQLQVSEKYL